MSNYVWYACYGTNVNTDRFMDYINNISCPDHTPPVDSRPFKFSHPIFFAFRSRKNWDNRGTAFLDDTVDGYALGRAYKITSEQFESVKSQEGPKYNSKLSLGEIDGVPVYSFTCDNPRRINPHEFIAPCKKLFDTSLKGLVEVYSEIEECLLASYLADAILSPMEYQALETIRSAEHGVSARYIDSETRLTTEEAEEAIKSLISKELIQQDRRTTEYDHRSNNARFFTVVEMRELIDEIIEFKKMARSTEDSSINEESTETIGTEICNTEGRQQRVFTTRYERNPANRRAAIRIHGTACAVCGFDFKKKYGLLGEGFIEVHHVVPLSSQNEEVRVNPETDLVCLCANCHRMIHKKTSGVYTVEELKRIIECNGNQIY